MTPPSLPPAKEEPPVDSNGNMLVLPPPPEPPNEPLGYLVPNETSDLGWILLAELRGSMGRVAVDFVRNYTQPSTFEQGFVC